MKDAIVRFAGEAKQIVESFLTKLESYQAPPVVYHYTTDAGLRGILQSGRIWLTDIFSLNDPSELRHGLSRAQAILNQKAASGPPESKIFAKDFSSLDKGLDRAAHYFVCSFSEAGDDLGQWRAYADNGRGYALGFDAKALEEAFGKGPETPTSNNAAFPVTYGDSILDGIQSQLIEKMFGLISLPKGRKQLYAEQFGDAIVTNTYLKLALLAMALVSAGLIYANVRTVRMVQNFKPLVIRINDIGRAEAVKYDTLGYKPQDAEIKYFLSDFCRLYYSRNRYTVRDNFKQSLLFMEARLANSVAEAYRKNHTVEGYLQDSSATDIDIDVGKLSIEDLRSAPYKATVDFYEIAYSPAEHVEIRRTLYTYREHEMPDVFSRKRPSIGTVCEHEEGRKSYSTQETYEGYLKKWIVPRWGSYRLGDVKAVQVEQWLKTVPLARGSKAKIRNIMSALYSHAIRWEWTNKNPITQVRQSAKRSKIPTVLSVEEIQRLFSCIKEPCRTAVILDAVSGLRVGELLGLKWEDVRFDQLELNVTRSVSRQVVTPCKTEVSRKPIPMNPEIAEMLFRWRVEAPYREPGDWIFASPHKAGIQPYWPGSLYRAHVKPALLKAGISAKVGWHTLRHSFGTLMKANGEDLKTIQELLRHATFKVTADTYTQAVTPVKRHAQAKIAKLILAEVPAAKPATPTIQ